MAKAKEAPSTPASPAAIPVVSTPGEVWKDEPDVHDYAAAASYLRLFARPKWAKKLANQLKSAPIEHHPAKDLLRASGLSLLPPDDPAVQRDLAKVAAGNRLSPVLIMRGDGARGFRAVIADGYHRICASYHLSENEQIPCRIIDYPRT